ncbi:MAG: helix-turn-helix domain-containing protein [Porphyromonadaceae bacterium]|nr:MAG: helix-turn-helix domain-containing protein [Porphyromonadaceae bacterium]
MTSRQIEIKNKLDPGSTFKISRFKEQIKRTVPHKHVDYHELIFLSEGEGFHWIESERYLVSTPEFYSLKPGQLHYWQFTSIPRGAVILFKDSYFNGIKEIDLVNLNRQLSENPRIKIPEGDFPDYILNEIAQEYNLNSAYSEHIIHGLLRALFGKLLHLSDNNSHGENLPESQFDKFQALLAKECPRLHKVNDFADLLNSTPQHLNTICRKHSGKSASELIAAQILLESKRYILHTENTINEIADILSFNDASYFVKFFKKAEGLTPVQFRQQYFQ